MTDALTGSLRAEHGDVLPSSVIDTAVALAGSGVRDPLDAERLARADVAALAAAVRRSPAPP